MHRSPFSLVLSLSGFLTLIACTRTSAQSGSAEADAAVAANQRLTDLASPPETRRLISSAILIDVEGQPSPDGKLMTITDWNTGDLAVFDLAAGAPKRLTNKGTWQTSNDFAESSAMSPDGKSVAYGWYSDEKKRFEMRLISLAGADSGKVRTVYAPADLSYAAPQAWTPDGKNVIATVTLDDRTSHIAIIPVNGDAMKRLKSFDWRYPSDIEVSPDGRWVAYDFPTDETSTARDVYVVALDGSREKAITTGKGDELVIGWTVDGSRLLFLSDRGGTPAVWAVKIESGVPSGDPILVRSGMWRMEPIGRSADGTLFYGVNTGTRNIFTAIRDPKTGRIASQPVPVGASPTTTIPFSASWSPDGKEIATLSVRGTGTTLYGPADVIIRSLDGGEVRRISPKLSRVTRLYWSPDGHSFLLRGNDLKGRPGIFRMDLQTGGVTTLKLGDRAGSFGQMLTIARDGKSAYFMRPDSTFKTSVVTRLDPTSGETTAIYSVTQPASLAGIAVSPDGRQLAVTLQGGEYGSGVVALMPVTGGTPTVIYRVPPSERPNLGLGLVWTPDGAEILMSAAPRSDVTNDRNEVRAIPVNGGAPHAVGIPGAAISTLQISSDGRRVAYGVNDFSAELWSMQAPKFDLRAANR